MEDDSYSKFRLTLELLFHVRFNAFPYILGLKLLALWSSIVVNVLVTLAVSICMNAARNRKTSGNSNHQCSSQVLAIVRDNSIVWALYSPVFSQRATPIASWT